MFIYVQTKHQYIIPYMYLRTGGENLSRKKSSTITARNCLSEGPS
jgi:hypothetical protein